MKTRSLLIGIPLLLTVGCDNGDSQNSRQFLAVDNARTARTLATAASAPLATALDEDALNTAIRPLLAAYLNGIPSGRERDFGFNSRDELKLPELGRPFAMFKLEKGPTVTFMGYWRVPLIVGGQARAIVDVGRGDSGYFVAGFGSAGFASTLQQQASRLGMAITGRGNQASILRTMIPRNDYLVCPGTGGLPASADEIRALPMHRTSSNSKVAAVAPCLSPAEISLAHDSN